MDSTEVIYLPTANGPMPIATEINGRLYAIDSEHLNTPRRLTNSQGQVAWQWLLSGYGEVAPTIGHWGFVHSNNSRKYSEAVKFDLRYPGQQWDEETGLAYNLHRYYDAATGRYIQGDPIGLEGGWNRFGYVDGNPVGYVDPEGLVKGIQNPRDLMLLDGGAGGVGGGWRRLTSPKPTSPPRITKFCESPSDSPIWKALPNYRGNIRSNGETGKKKNYYQWDHTHGDIDVYNRNGGHLGSMNPLTGLMHKPAVAGRILEGVVMSTEEKFCCNSMQHAVDSTEIAFKYSPKFREYGILYNNGGSYQVVHFCPWCGTSLPSSLREEWFEKLDQLGIEPDGETPIAMQTNEWWASGSQDAISQ